jgi:hypothetical protein
VFEKKSPRYRECVRRGLSRCDVRRTPEGSLSTLIEEEVRLKAERDAVIE